MLNKEAGGTRFAFNPSISFTSNSSATCDRSTFSNTPPPLSHAFDHPSLTNPMSVPLKVDLIYT